MSLYTLLAVALLASVLLGGLLGRLWQQHERRDIERKWQERERLLDRRRFPTQAEARMAVFDFIEGWYNPHRRHSGLDCPTRRGNADLAALGPVLGEAT